MRLFPTVNSARQPAQFILSAHTPCTPTLNTTRPVHQEWDALVIEYNYPTLLVTICIVRI